MDKKLRNTLILGIIVLAIAVSYYFVYRPLRLENIKKTCVQQSIEEAKEDAKEVFENRSPIGTVSAGGWRQTNEIEMPSQGYYDYKFEYFLGKCLQENGILNSS